MSATATTPGRQRVLESPRGTADLHRKSPSRPAPRQTGLSWYSSSISGAPELPLFGRLGDATGLAAKH